MNRINPYIIVFFAIMFSLTPVLAECDCAQTSITGVPQSECEALVVFYNSTGGEIWGEGTGWNSATPVYEWAGITVTNGHITELSMGHWLEGFLPSELGNLTKLETLEIEYGYHLDGSIPPEIGSLFNLRTLTLKADNLSGNIPQELGNLSNLQYLDLSANYLDQIPPELGNLSNLEVLNLEINQITEIPPELGNLHNLRELTLNRNQLTGSIPPWLGDLSNLEILILGENQLKGSLPIELGNLTRLRHLYLHENKLTGVVPQAIGNLREMEALLLSDNKLEGTLPPGLCGLENLNQIDLSGNKITGTIPSYISGLKNLEELDLSRNNLSGIIPAEIGTLVKLRGLSLYGNMLTGPIPYQIINLKELKTSSTWFHGHSYAGYNALFIDPSGIPAFPSLKTFMDYNFPDWSLSQTLPPENPESMLLYYNAPAGIISELGGIEGTNRIRLTWNPIIYQEDDGGYEICLRNNPEGHCVADAGITANKEESTIVISDLIPDTEYYLDISSKSFPSVNNPNSINSNWTGPLAITTGSIAVTAFPLWKMKAGEFTGLAFSNYGYQAANISLSAFGEDGDILSVPINPSMFNVDSGKQIARLGTELFGVAEIYEELSWVEMGSDELLGTFFTFGSSDMRMLDGAITQSRPSKWLYFTRPIPTGALERDGDLGEVSLVLINPFDERAELTLYLKQDGEMLASRSVNLPAKGMTERTAKDLFGTSNLINDGYVEIKTKTGEGVIGFSRVDFPETKTTLALNAAEPSSAETLYSAQLASGPGVGGTGMETHIRLVNPMKWEREVTFSAVADNGTLLAESVTRTLSGQTAAEYKAWELFEFEGDSAVGSLVVEANAGGLVGDVIFTPFEGIEYAAAMPFQTRPVTEAVFNHIANSEDIYTGLAFFNPGEEEAQIAVIAKKGDGTEAGTRILNLGPDKRISRTLKDPDMLPETAFLLNGFICIVSTQPIICQQLFGGTDLQFLAAVPPTTFYSEILN